MKKIPKSIWITLGVMAAIYAAWNIAYPSATIRYKMTVAVETPEGIKTGSAVREVHASVHSHFFASTSSGGAGIRGEAVVVDLGQRGVLFGLMRGGIGGVDYGHYIVFDAFPAPSCTDCPWSPEGIRYYRSLKSGTKVTLTPQRYPMFVRFRDLNDPKTVEAISQYNDRPMPTGYGEIAKMSEEMFGAGVKIKEVTIEMTNEPLTKGIERWLPWLKNLKSNIDGTSVTMSKTLSNNLDVGAFKRGEEQ